MEDPHVAQVLASDVRRVEGNKLLVSVHERLKKACDQSGKRVSSSTQLPLAIMSASVIFISPARLRSVCSTQSHMMAVATRCGSAEGGVLPLDFP